MGPDMTLRLTRGRISIPIATYSDGAHTQQAFCAGLGPAHAREFATVFDKMTASAFDNTGSNRPTFSQVDWIVHVRQVALEVVGCDLELTSLCGGCLGQLGLAQEISDELVGFS